MVQDCENSPFGLQKSSIILLQFSALSSLGITIIPVLFTASITTLIFAFLPVVYLHILILKYHLYTVYIMVFFNNLA